MKKQWHPLFVHLPRLLVGEWYAIDPEAPSATCRATATHT